MKNVILLFMSLVWAGTLVSCSKELEFKEGDLQIRVEQGSAYLHDFPLFCGIKTKNAPQIAVWIEDAQGNYLSTVYVSRKIATQGWMMAKGNRRKEALPHWCYSRGVVYQDGLYLPDKAHPLPDGISGATPTKSFDLKLKKSERQHFVVKVEVNHSTDFNEHYPKNAKKGEAGYSGGEEGSGQPALIYRAEVDLSEDNNIFEAVLIGHSSPDGTDGEIHTDMEGLTSALNILKRVSVIVHR